MITLIQIKATGNFDKSFSYFRRLLQLKDKNKFEEFGRKGLEALKAATPIDSGKTAESWNYSVSVDRKGATITWYNNNVNDGFNVAIGIQYGHGTNNGGYVQGRDYINPAIRPVFDELAGDLWREVTK